MSAFSRILIPSALSIGLLVGCNQDKKHDSTVPSKAAKVEAPKVSEAPKVEAPKTDAPKAEAPKVDAPKPEAPKVEAPKVEAPKVETPKVDAPKAEAPKVETPKVETPKVDAPTAEAPKVDAPKVDAPKVDAPKVEAPKVETPKVEAPKADAPKVEAPKVAAPTTKPAPKKEPADVGSIKGNPDDPKNGFLARHEGFLKDLASHNGKVGLLLVGDSITDGWRGRGKETFAEAYGKLDPYNIGIGGDRTQHVIWRLDHGEVEGISPKVAMLMIGTNNLSGNTDDEIVAGITKIVKQLNTKLPQTKVLLLGIFPRGADAKNPARDRIKAINEKIMKLDDGGKTVKYLDIGAKFLDADGNLPKDIMPDALHPNEKGYKIWADAVQPTLDELMK